VNRKLDPLLEKAIRDGMMTREEAEKVDAWCGEIATRTKRGELSVAEGERLARERATVDAHERLRRRRS
jgi:hypothetical protein